MKNKQHVNVTRNDCDLELTEDASNIAVGAVLEQITPDSIREPLGFYSTKLTVNGCGQHMIESCLYFIMLSCFLNTLYKDETLFLSLIISYYYRYFRNVNHIKFNVDLI